MSQTFTEDFTDQIAHTGHHHDEPEPEPFYPHAQAWVVGWLLPHYRRSPKTRRWDPQWWRYEEVATLLEALWETWEQKRWEGATGMVVFFRDYLWPVIEEITATKAHSGTTTLPANAKSPHLGTRIRPQPLLHRRRQSR